jgi:hypothetical protein
MQMSSSILKLNAEGRPPPPLPPLLPGAHQRQQDSNTEFESTELENRCCYITVDSTMAASQNGFCSHKLHIHKKSNIMQILTKNIKIFIIEPFIIEKL